MATAVVPRSVFSARPDMAVSGRRLGVNGLYDIANLISGSRLGVSVVKHGRNGHEDGHGKGEPSRRIECPRSSSLTGLPQRDRTGSHLIPSSGCASYTSTS